MSTRDRTRGCISIMTSISNPARKRERSPSALEHGGTKDEDVHLSPESKRSRLLPIDACDDRPDVYHDSLTSRNAALGSPEILLNVLSFLTVQELVTIETVCRHWRSLAVDGSLWRRMYLGESACLIANTKSSRSCLCGQNLFLFQACIIFKLIPSHMIDTLRRNKNCFVRWLSRLPEDRSSIMKPSSKRACQIDYPRITPLSTGRL